MHPDLQKEKFANGPYFSYYMQAPLRLQITVTDDDFFTPDDFVDVITVNIPDPSSIITPIDTIVTGEHDRSTITISYEGVASEVRLSQCNTSPDTKSWSKIIALVYSTHLWGMVSRQV